MTIQRAVANFVITDSAVTALVTQRIYPQRLPQNPEYPALVFRRVSGPQVHNLAGAAGRAVPRVQIDCYAETYTQMEALADAVKARLDGFRGTMTTADSPALSFVVDTCKLENSLDFDESDVPNKTLHRRAQDYMVNHRE